MKKLRNKKIFSGKLILIMAKIKKESIIRVWQEKGVNANK